MVGELIRLTLAVRRHSPTEKRLLGLVLGIAAAVATWLVMVFAEPPARADVLMLVLAGWLLGWLVGPILSSGAAVLRPEYFTLLPLDRRRLGSGLLAAVFVGVGAGVTAAALLALIGYAAATAPGPAVVPAMVVALLGAVLLLVLVVALSRAAYALLGTAMRTRVGVEIAAIQYGLLIATVFAGWLAISSVVRAVPVFLRTGFDGSAATTVLARLPSGWPVRAIDAVAAGDYPLALGRLGALAVVTAAAVVTAVALLTPHVGERTARRRRRPLGSRVTTRPRVLPGTPLGAVVGKELRIWWRDPWRSLELRSSVWFGIFLAAYGLLAGQPRLAGLAGVAVTLMVALSGANLLGQDGTALWQLVVGQSPRAVRADIRGRQVGLVVALGVPALGLSALMVALTGRYDDVVPILAVIVAMLGAGSGIAVLMSVVGVTPGVDPHRRVDATDAGENTFVIMVALHAVILLVTPTLAMATLLTLHPPWLPQWFAAATLTVAVLDAVLVGWAGGALAGRRLATHLPETFARLRYPGTAGATGGGGTGLLDRLAAAATSSAATTAKGRPRGTR